MKKQSYLILIIAFVLITFMGCVQRPLVAVPQETTKPSTTTPPPETTVPVTTTVPSVEHKVTYKTLFDMIDEAEEHLKTNQIIRVPVNTYTQICAKELRLISYGYVSEEDGFYVFTDQTDEKFHKRLLYLIFLSNVVTKYEEDIVWTNYNKESPKTHTESILLAVGCEDYGYNNSKEYLDDGRKLEENIIEYIISLENAYVSMRFKDGEYTLLYKVYSASSTAQTLYNGLATGPWLILGPDQNYQGDGIPPC